MGHLQVQVRPRAQVQAYPPEGSLRRTLTYRPICASWTKVRQLCKEVPAREAKLLQVMREEMPAISSTSTKAMQ
jgi:hypothetical protein